MHKRLFIGFSIASPWPDTYPQGRVIEEKYRHLTLAFLGDCDIPPLDEIPRPSFAFGPVGRSDRILFLPELTPRVVAEHIEWHSGLDAILHYQNDLLDWLHDLGIHVERRSFLPHISLARAPFVEKHWEEAFEPKPVVVTGVHLYESIGSLRYPSLFEISIPPPFEEFQHTADLAFYIYANTFTELYLHAVFALAFNYPPLLGFYQPSSAGTLQEVVRLLNQTIAACDAEIGAPFKAVSHHGTLHGQTPLKWEMIVDV